ncbi:putative rhamnosyltransferase [Stackebrandtia albiflava]|uniref:Putative rhamnosyltransferase n=1 Tax=Stackebrandtia albiflava TaxID=406432 RepID=A0A562V383_9ACTN|nr:glycosyltransferase [Stackebrandtia albiflava]TWJ12331.1 putative rhamnosyltransferase [Stackebrandtia albiflava]
MAATEFLHVLSTRVGIGVYDEGWFDYRLRLFESVTVPSMAAQTSQDFTWLLVVDAKMPPRARSRFDAVVAPLANVRVREVEFKTDFRGAVVEWCQAEAARRGLSRVLTSRLDDDDALRVDAFERLQSEAADAIAAGHSDLAVFSLNLGCMWSPSHRRGYTRYHDSHSLGLSLLEPAEAVECVYSRPHREIKQRYAPRGAYIRGVDGGTRWWLYAAHAIADSDKGDGARRDKILKHRYGYHLDDDLLAGFGLDPAAVAALAEAGEPTPTAPTKFLSLRAMETERRIKALRTELAGASFLRRRLLTQRLARLESEREKAGSGIVTR